MGFLRREYCKEKDLQKEFKLGKLPVVGETTRNWLELNKLKAEKEGDEVEEVSKVSQATFKTIVEEHHCKDYFLVKEESLESLS